MSGTDINAPLWCHWGSDLASRRFHTVLFIAVDLCVYVALQVGRRVADRVYDVARWVRHMTERRWAFGFIFKRACLTNILSVPQDVPSGSGRWRREKPHCWAPQQGRVLSQPGDGSFNPAAIVDPDCLLFQEVVQRFFLTDISENHLVSVHQCEKT